VDQPRACRALVILDSCCFQYGIGQRQFIDDPDPYKWFGVKVKILTTMLYFKLLFNNLLIIGFYFAITIMQFLTDQELVGSNEWSRIDGSWVTAANDRKG